jgi:hypothetical protein
VGWQWERVHKNNNVFSPSRDSWEKRKEGRNLHANVYLLAYLFLRYYACNTLIGWRSAHLPL